MSAAHREATVQALKTARRGDWSRAGEVIRRTGDPLAEKIFNWLYYARSGQLQSFDRVTAFIRRNPEWPSQGTLKRAAEKALNDKVRDEDVVYWFRDYPPQTVDAMDRYLRALAVQGRAEEMKKALRGWWKGATLTADQQSRFLKSYSRHLDTAANVARLDTLLLGGQYTNARAIARVLGRGYPQLAEARIVLSENKGGVDGRLAHVPAHLRNDPGLLYERLRWRRRHNLDFEAIEILHSQPPADKINNLPDWWTEQHIIARRLIENKQYESAYLLVSKHQQKEGIAFAQAEFLAGWLALRFLNKPWDAFEHFEKLYRGTVTPASRSKAAYWAGRASEALKHNEVAIKWYRAAARYQTVFYGQMAIGALDDAYKPPQQLPPEKKIDDELAFDAKEMVQAAKLLHKAGYRKETTAFLDALASSVKTPEDYLLVAELSEKLDHYHNAVRIAKEGLSKNIMLMDHAYPTLLQRMKRVNIEWALVHALIRQESAFDYEAESPAGALGLMQIMPATAREVAKKNGLSYNPGRLTSDPDYNIRLGTSYMQSLLDRFDGSYALALAGYNGGPARVSQWLDKFGDPRKGEIDMIDWIELIPVYETRNYVQKVLEGVYIYRLKLQGVQKSANSPIHVSYEFNR